MSSNIIIVIQTRLNLNDGVTIILRIYPCNSKYQKDYHQHHRYQRHDQPDLFIRTPEYGYWANKNYTPIGLLCDGYSEFQPGSSKSKPTSSYEPDKKASVSMMIPRNNNNEPKPNNHPEPAKMGIINAQ